MCLKWQKLLSFGLSLRLVIFLLFLATVRYIVWVPTLKNGLQRVLSEYQLAKHEDFKDHVLANFIRDDLRQIIQKVVGDSYLVDASPGKGNWAHVPWVSIFDPMITTSARVGYYPVFLFSSNGSKLYLSLNQARFEVKEEFGNLYKEVLTSRAEVARGLLRNFLTESLYEGFLDLESEDDLPVGYSVGNILSVEYKSGSLPSDEVIVSDIHKILALYRSYIALRSGNIDSDIEDIPEEISTGEEKKKYRWHRRTERNQKLSKDAKKFHGYVCQVCKFDFEKQYGELGSKYVEAHHITPMAELIKELEPVVLDPKTDFVVVCSNCHRMLHRTKPVLIPSELRKLLSKPWNF